MEQVYTDSARSPLQEYIIKLNQRCLVQMDDSKYKAGRHLWPPLYFYFWSYMNKYNCKTIIQDSQIVDEL
jgi:hypothetical protein